MILGFASHVVMKSFHLEHYLNSSPTTIKNNDVDATNINNTSLVLKSSANLSLLFNQFNTFSPEQKNKPENVVNSIIMTLTNFKL